MANQNMSLQFNDTPEEVARSLKKEHLELVEKMALLLVNQGLSFQQAELLLDITKARLRRAAIVTP